MNARLAPMSQSCSRRYHQQNQGDSTSVSRGSARVIALYTIALESLCLLLKKQGTL